jgi:5-methyltetrahydrofolate--homocysteine methyltransferase
VSGDVVSYSGTPELMAEFSRLALDAGARIIGGCCGTSAAHLAAMRRALEGHRRGPRPDVERIVAALGPLVSPPARSDAVRRVNRRRAG